MKSYHIAFAGTAVALAWVLFGILLFAHDSRPKPAGACVIHACEECAKPTLSLPENTSENLREYKC
jgi:hypothetical protein